jgi:hypothetical protein
MEPRHARKCLINVLFDDQDVGTTTSNDKLRGPNQYSSSLTDGDEPLYISTNFSSIFHHFLIHCIYQQTFLLFFSSS